MNGFDMNLWGVYAMPVGVAICFGPVLVAWALACRESKPQPQARLERKDKR